MTLRLTLRRVFLVAATLLLLPIGPALACSCAPPSPEDYLRRASDIFTGLATRTQSRQTTFQVSEKWKGNVVGEKKEPNVSRSVITIDHGVVEGLPPTHPGEILREELTERGLSANAFAAKLKVPTNRITEILAGRRSISAETALRLGRFFGTSAQFWMNLQTNYDLKQAVAASGKEIVRQVRPPAA
jgi:addiction module HigA family antidote